uniref:Methyltransferase domain-containing protein n=1 Tax=Gibberella zeae TaxID=5518 RepID=A0A4E9E9Q9_GIBZA
MVQNYESDHDPEKSLGYVDINGSTDWLSVTPSDTINFIIQLAKDKAQTSAWDIKTSQPISADFSLLSGMADWDCDNCYVEPPSSDSVTRVKKWVSGYNNDETLGAREVLILVNQESDSLVASLQSARIPLIIGSATIWTRKVCLQGPLAPGTSGSWVVDRISGALCGSIIIVYDGEPYALMMTDQTLLSDIRAYSSMAVDETMFPTVSEPMRNELEELQSFVGNSIPGKLSPESKVDSTSDDHDSDINCSLPNSVSSITSSIFNYDVVNSRTYQTVHGKYWAPTDQISLDAMELFYQTTFLVLGSKLYLAPLDANQVHRVLDIGTGSGTWAMDFADATPEAEVIGIDISPIQPVFVPPNLQFEIDDFTKEWTFKANSRDLIHMRFLGGGVSDWRSLYENAFRVTKPGGWIETHEFDPGFHSQNDSIVHGSAIAAWGSIFEEGCKKLGTSFIPIPSKVQQEHLEAVGFVDIQSQIIRVPVGRWAKEENMEEIGTYALGSIASDIQGWVNFMAYTCDWKEDDIREYCVQLRKERATKTTQLYYYQQIVWGRKPHDGK